MALDPIDFFYSDGTITLTNGSDIAQGTFTAWDPAVLPYDLLFANDGQGGASAVKEVLSVNQLRLAKAWTGPTLTNVPYFILRWIKHTDPRIYGVRVSDYLTRLKAIPENLEEVAGEINADRQAVEAAMATLAAIETAVDADRQAAETAAGAASQGAATATQQAGIAQQWAEAASSTVLPDNGVSNAKLADMPANTIKGTTTAGDPKDLTGAEAAGILPVVRYDVAQALSATQQSQGRSNLGIIKQSYTATAGASGFIVPIPAGVRFMRLRGRMFPTALGSAFVYSRLSFDNGAIYLDTGYGYGFAGGVDTAFIGDGDLGVTSEIAMTGLPDNALAPILFDSTASLPVAGDSVFYMMTRGSWYYSTQGFRNMLYAGWYGSGTARPTHIFVACAGTTLKAASHLVAEFE
jgi:hypothetical protein